MSPLRFAAQAETILNRETNPSTDPNEVRSILACAKELRGVSPQQALVLMNVNDPDLVFEIEETARCVKDTIYGPRVVLFAPLYLSNSCQNDCAYCAFRVSNRAIQRRSLSCTEVRNEAETLVRSGHKRILLVAGESPSAGSVAAIQKAIETVYSVHLPQGSIRRININLAPLTVEQFREIARTPIGTFQVFQETYHPETYHRVHLSGPKRDYDFRLEAMDRAMTAGIQDVGIGALFGLHDWRFEALCLLLHARHLEDRYGAGPHTISVPRIEPANGSELSQHPPHELSDAEFRRLISVFRLALPYVGLILSTRESPQMRRDALSLGISQLSAGSRTDPGGYTAEGTHPETLPLNGQFSLGDHRPLREVIDDLIQLGHIPSFCTGCYRKGRVGKDFMDLAKPGLIRRHCTPNAILTFSEYLRDFGSEKQKQAGLSAIEHLLDTDIDSPTLRKSLKERLQQTWQGKSDLYY